VSDSVQLSEWLRIIAQNMPPSSNVELVVIAADTIESLTAERDALKAERDEAREIAESLIPDQGCSAFPWEEGEKE